jgi:predicted ABC-type transport system involved in lysophospholipase L1 biosynthesis ATPase subunit
MSDLVLEFLDVTKDYRGLRPLRIRHLELREAQTLAVTGVDQAAAEIFVNLATGATVPDAGDVRVFGESTAGITDADAWLASLDRFGILSERAVVLDGLNALQNIAMPFTLEVDPLTEPLRARAIGLAREAGLDGDDLGKPVGDLMPPARLRVRLGRALALQPRVLIAEHPNAALPPADLPAFAADFAAVVAARGIAALTLTADRTFAAAVAEQVLTLQPATGELKAAAGWRRWFAGR